jgi:hypothetical protein
MNPITMSPREEPTPDDRALDGQTSEEALDEDRAASERFDFETFARSGKHER